MTRRPPSKCYPLRGLSAILGLLMLMGMHAQGFTQPAYRMVVIQEEELCKAGSCAPYRITLEYPFFEAKGSPLLDELNIRIQTHVDSLCNSFKQGMSYIGQEGRDLKRDIPSELEISTQWGMNDGYLLCFALKESRTWATGNARSEAAWNTFNLDLLKGKELTWTATFQLRKPEKEWMAYLRENEALGYPESSSPNHFLLDADGGAYLEFKGPDEVLLLGKDELSEWFARQ